MKLNQKCLKLRQSRKPDPSPEPEDIIHRKTWMEQEQLKQKLSLTGSKFAHLEPNTNKEMHCACPFYQGEEISIPAPVKSNESDSFRFKKFNPILDLIDQRINEKQNCFDIEDMIKSGKKNNICPYYLAKSRLPAANIVVLPYSYLLTPSIRRKL